MPRIPLLLLASLLALTLAACRGEEKSPQPPSGSGQFAGQVLQADQPERGVAGAEITLLPGKIQTTADAEGRFVFEGLHLGAYRLEIAAEGYEPLLAPQAFITLQAHEATTYFLFPLPQAAAKAVLEVPGGGMSAPGYNTEITVDASRSMHASREGFRWEVVNQRGEVVMDPYGPGKSLQLKTSSLPGATPYIFTFAPPEPGEYRVKLFLSNNAFPQESLAEVTLRAANIAPKAVASVIPGPVPPQKEPTGARAATPGLNVVTPGQVVYLRGWGLDANAPSPELYNPGGNKADLYGKNQDHYQRQFAWDWVLQYTPAVDGSGQWEDVSYLLKDGQGGPGQDVQHPHFTAENAGMYRAWLAVNDQDAYDPRTGLPAPLDVLVVDGPRLGSETCAGCHKEKAGAWQETLHAQLGLLSCEDCHGPGSKHVAAPQEKKKETIAVSYRSGLCGQCHQEYGQWQKSRHSDGYPYGYLEVAEPLLLNCARCHYTRGYAAALELAREEGSHFGGVEFKQVVDGQLMFDFSQLPSKDGEGVSCVTCHDPHGGSAQPQLRVDGRDGACNTCHEEKWQNVLLEGTAAGVGSGYEYPGENYGLINPHNTEEKCILCHMAGPSQAVDTARIALVGGHTMRMRDAGANGLLGGYGPRADDPAVERMPQDGDDVLNTAPCRDCHVGIKDFNMGGFQAEIYGKWLRLGELLRAANQGMLPDFRPGDKCATCHRGGTEPFSEDPEMVLENAYSNYKLVKNDRSWGVHNPSYIKKLLEDSLAAMEQYARAGR